jgi:predicted glycoside hydrolase/deacetylase ChbG (UPF0249 family)
VTAPCRLLIVNADDFGLTAGVNAGIIGALERGIVRSASLMVTGPGFADAVALARDHPGLDLGIHLALTGVSPALPPGRIPSLVGADGRFPRLGAWLRRVVAGRLDPGDVRDELTAQLARALRTGLPFTHLDGHHHAHLFGPVAAIVADLARQAVIPVVRRVRDDRGGQEPPFPASVGEAVKRGLLNAAERRWGRAYAPLARTRAFRGFRFPASIADWRELCRSLPVGVTEMMCHPGLVDPAVAALDPYVAERAAELRWLCDRRVLALLDEHGVTLANFSALTS